MFFQRLVACYCIQVCTQSRVISATSCARGDTQLRHYIRLLLRGKKRPEKRRREGASTSRSAKGKYARWEGREGRSENNEFTTGTCLGALQNESYLPTMIAALHGLIAPANVTKGYADHEFVIGSLNDLSARSTCPYTPMTAASSQPTT